jgi:hypothetical protein
VGNPLRALLSGQNLRYFGVRDPHRRWLILDGTIGVFAGHFKKLGTDPGTVPEHDHLPLAKRLRSAQTLPARNITPNTTAPRSSADPKHLGRDQRR